MKKSKGAKASKLKDGVDRISNLSDDILHSILSRLPTTEEVVRTSILSTRWRYLWTSFSYSSLDLDFSRTLKSPSRFEMNKFRDFMDRVLVNKTLDLDSFRLCCSNYDNMRIIGRWIDAAITRKVKLLHLMLCPMKDFKVPHCLVNSASLEVLRLVLCGSILSLPNFTTGLPALRVLELNNVKLVNNDLVEEFLKSCPLLEDLSLIDCWMHKIVGRVCISCPELKNLRFDNREVYQHLTGSVRINCPKLVFFEVAGYIYHVFHFERSLNSLKKAVLCPQLLQLRPEVSLVDMPDSGDLALGIITETFYAKDEDYELPDPEVDVPPAPLNPKTVEVTTTVDFLTKDGLFNLLIEIPNLESLHLIIIEGPFWPCLYSNLGEDRMLVLTDHLKRVEFVDFNGEKEKLFVARSLLEYGHVLEEMVFSWGNEATYRERSMETMKEVSKFPWASTVKLISLLKN